MDEAPHSCPVTELDPWSDDVVVNPWPAYRTLRDLGPVVWLAGHGMAALARFDGVRAALTDHQRFSSASGVSADEARNLEMGETILTSDPPIHESHRRPLATQLTPASLAPDLPHIDAVADALIERLVGVASFDAVTEMASPFSVNVVADLVGLPAEGRELIGPLGERAFNIMGPRDARNDDGGLALEQLMEYSVGTALSGQLCPGTRGADLVAQGLPAAVTAYTWPGVDTTVHALGSAVLCFAENPDQWDLLRADPSLVPSAFNEVLRLHTPVQTFTRRTTEPVDVEGVVLSAGQRVAVMFGSANRDERRYPDPDRFDVTRNPLDQLAFGRGIHLCVGIHLARAEAHSLFAALARRVRRFELVGEPVWKLNNTLHGLASLPVRAVPA